MSETFAGASTKGAVKMAPVFLPGKLDLGLIFWVILLKKRLKLSFLPENLDRGLILWVNHQPRSQNQINDDAIIKKTIKELKNEKATILTLHPHDLSRYNGRLLCGVAEGNAFDH